MIYFLKTAVSGLTVVSFFLLADFLRVWLVGNHFRQTGSEEGFYRIWTVHVLLVLVAVVIFYLVLVLVPSKFKAPHRRRILDCVLLAGLVGLMSIIESQHHYKKVVLGVIAGGGGAVLFLGLGAFTRVGVGYRYLVLIQGLILLLPLMLGLFRPGVSKSSHPGGATGLPNIFLIVVDTVRSDHLSCYGYPRNTTPFLDQLALKSLRFDRAYSATSTTTPSTAAILGAPYPYTNDFPENRMIPASLGLAAYLAQAGYQTGAVSANPFIAPTMGFDDGFQSFQNLRFPEKDYALTHVLWVLAEKVGVAMPDQFRGELVNQRAKKWLASLDREEAPVFCFLHYMDPHYPYTPRPRYRSRFLSSSQKAWQRFPAGVDFGQVPFHEGTPIDETMRASMVALYDAEISQWDDALNEMWMELLKEGWLDNALVVVTSDHGEAFYEHKTWIHGNSLFEETTRVPFLVYQSWDQKPGVVFDPISNTATFSMIKDLLREYPENRSAFDPADSMTPEDRKVLLQHVYGVFRGAAIVDGFEKRSAMFLKDRPLYLHFSLEEDPGETRNLSPDSTDLDPSRWESVISLVPEAIGSPGNMGKSTEELLKSLGYIQ